ncbi:hypothetical protein O6H91_03G131400 [Diphasiastrum complanatum]|uniref:Uncharacterized protein n=2 Tax=Diphasiastrum complanatum TaxID=34168 RepID=A0ACC2E7B5_DIPCM|nr:hypothetical protein O6H91_03G067300 [Diphasiastrum complanatum]KAJ7563941.1 hypothetical protein O6H91_03G131400 [Diphasiastrum complanatum]
MRSMMRGNLLKTLFETMRAPKARESLLKTMLERSKRSKRVVASPDLKILEKMSCSTLFKIRVALVSCRQTASKTHTSNYSKCADVQVSKLQMKTSYRRRFYPAHPC